MTNNISLVHRVLASIPAYIRESAPEFTEFLVSYYKYLEEEGEVSELIRFQENLYGFKDDADYVRKFLRGLGFDVGADINLEADLQYRLINDFFAMRGTEPSLKLMFRMLFNEDVNVEYPRDKLLYLSSANYTKNIFIITTAPNNIIIPDTTFAGVTGLTSRSTATVENIDVIVSDKKYLLIECSFASDSFVVDEVIRIMFKDQNIDVVNVGAIDIDVENGGNGYSLFESVNISGCGQTGVGYVSAITYGSIETLEASVKGTGYAVGDKITAFNGFFAKVKEVDTLGGIEKIEIKHGGYKYKEYPEFNLYSKTGTGAILTPFGSKVGGIKTITFENPYTLCSASSIIGVNSSRGYGFIGNLVVSANIKNNKWTDRKGMLAINSVLLDSDEYQEYSYRIISNVPTNKYLYFVDQLTHPYGFVRVPLFLRQIEMDFMLGQQISTLTINKERQEISDIIINEEDLTDMNVGDEANVIAQFEYETVITELYNDDGE